MKKQNDSLRNVNVRLLEQERQRLHRTLDVQYDKFVQEVLTNGHPELVPEGECLWSLEDRLRRFKGTKVTGIWLKNGKILPVRSWKEAAVELLRECNTDPIMHDRLLALRNILGGRFRCLLSSDADIMSTPLQIDEGLYLEGKLDTEFLLKTVTKEIMDRIGYDYSRIGILIKDPELEIGREQAQHQGMQGLGL